MGDAARQLAEGIHALRLPERLLLLELLGDVADEPHDAEDVAVRIANDRGNDLAGKCFAVLAPEGHPDRIDLARLSGALKSSRSRATRS